VAPGRRVKCWCTRYKGILVKGKQGKGKGTRKGLYSLVEVGDNETDRDKRLEIDEHDNGKRVKLNYQQRPVHATSKKEPALLQRGTATGRSLGVAHLSLSSRGTLAANGAESINRKRCKCLDAHKTAMHLINAMHIAADTLTVAV